MSTYAYKDAFNTITNIIQELTPEEQIRLLDDIKATLQNNEETEPLHDVMEFRGIAKDFWKNVDVQKYIDEERNSWDG
ncbi:MAG: hypothetical protein NVSMB38_33520 [Ktedonobacteraceae bacterium]